MRSVEIYGYATGCNPCQQAKRFLESFRIPYVFRDIRDDEAAKAEMFSRNPDAKTVPQIFVADILIGGRDELLAIPTPQLQQMIGE
jgi:glutaredoxin